MTLKTICEDVGAEVGVEVPALIVGNTDETAKTLLRLANTSGIELSVNGAPELRDSHVFSLASDNQNYDFPVGFGYLIEDTIYVDGSTRGVILQNDTAEWSRLRASNVGTSTLMMRVGAGKFEILNKVDTSLNGAKISFDFMSKLWCAGSNGDRRSRFERDDDSALLDEEAITRQVIWRFRKHMGLPWEADAIKAANYANIATTKKAGVRTINVFGESPRRDPFSWFYEQT